MRTFVFLVHPRTVEDVVWHFSLPSFLAHSPVLRLTLERVLPWVPPQTIAQIKDTENPHLYGEVMALPFTTRLLREEKFQQRAVRHLKRLLRQLGQEGVFAVGLGALLSSVTLQGRLLVSTQSSNLPLIATGRLLTVYNMTELYERLAREIYPQNYYDIPVTVLGAAGSIGSGTAVLLAARGFRRFYLVDLLEKEGIVKEVASHMKQLAPNIEIRIAHRATDVLPRSYGIVTATSREDAVIPAKLVLPGTFIVDDAQPSDVEPQLFDSSGVVVASGGAMFAPHLRARNPLFFLAEGHVFSCLAETYLFARFPELAYRFQPNHLPRFPDPGMVAKVGEIARSVGIHPGKIHNPRKMYTQEDLAQARRAGEQRLDSSQLW